MVWITNKFLILIKPIEQTKVISFSQNQIPNDSYFKTRMKRNRHSNKNNNVSIKDKFPVDSYCAEMTSWRNKLVGSSIPKSSKGILNFSKNQTVTVDELEKWSNKLAKPNTSINSSSAHTLLTKSKTDFYEKNVFQNKFYEVVSFIFS